ncbi:MAG: helix-turn-helix transcriptional regulator [Verrucomicrobiota bacterium]|jgi:DNA-binding XRE family transcriptional regulator
MPVARFFSIQRQFRQEGKHSIPIWDFGRDLFNLLEMDKSLRSPESEKLAALLRSVRSESGLTQAEVAKRLKMPQSFVSKYESGERRVDLVELRHICKALGISLADFVHRFERDIS